MKMEFLDHSIQNTKRELLRNVKKLLNSYYDAILCRFKKQYYARLFNLRSLLLSNGSIIEVLGENYQIKDKNFKGVSYLFSQEFQGSYAYKLGLKKFIVKLGEDYLLDKIKFKDGDMILDCGANNGDLKLWFDLKKYNINYNAFEPSIREFECLQENVYPSICHNIALWNKEEKRSLFVASQGADSSLIQPRNYEREVTLMTRKLKNFINNTIKLLKIDGEGAELEILEGAEEKISLIEFITVDLGFERGVAEESTLIPVVNYLLSKGFILIGFNHKRLVACFKNKNI